jgi:hypothetical protein
MTSLQSAIVNTGVYVSSGTTIDSLAAPLPPHLSSAIEIKAHTFLHNFDLSRQFLPLVVRYDSPLVQKQAKPTEVYK